VSYSDREIRDSWVPTKAIPLILLDGGFAVEERLQRDKARDENGGNIREGPSEPKVV